MITLPCGASEADSLVTDLGALNEIEKITDTRRARMISSSEFGSPDYLLATICRNWADEEWRDRGRGVLAASVP